MLHMKRLSAFLGSVLAATVIAADSVIIFNPMQIDSKKLDSGLFNDIVSAELSCTEGIKLVDRNQFDKLLRERSLKPNGMLNSDDVSNIGSLLGADYFVSGSVREKENLFLIFVKGISVKTGVVKMKYINTPAELEDAARKTAQTAADLLKQEKEVNSSRKQTENILLYPEKTRPVVAIYIPEIHITNQRVIDPAAENELIKIFLNQKFNVKQLSSQLETGKDGLLGNIVGNRSTLLKAAKKTGADYFIYGEAVSEAADTFGNYRTSRARVELKVISTSTDDIVWADSAYAGAADTTEVIAGKKAIQKAAEKLALKMAESLLK